MIYDLIINATKMVKEVNDFKYPDLSHDKDLQRLIINLETEVKNLNKLVEIKNYKINYLNDNTAIVFSINYISPTNQLDRITEEFNKNNFKGTVIFDLLLNNRYGSQRLFEGSFDSKFKEFKDISISLESSLITILNKFYADNIDLLEYSVLSETEKYLIKKLALKSINT